MQHRPFESIYRPDFEVVEQRRGHVSLFPHTDQLPLLLRALNLEFYGGLPGRIARVDRRADGFPQNCAQDRCLDVLQLRQWLALGPLAAVQAG